MKLLLAAALLAASAFPAAAHYCDRSPDFEGRSLVLWVTDKTNPDEAACLARLAYTKCDAATQPDGTVPTASLRYFGGQGVAAVLAVGDSGDVTVTLNFAGALGIPSGVARVGTFPYHRALYRGIGIDKVRVYDLEARSSKPLGNVFLIPAENLTERALKLCPADR